MPKKNHEEIINKLLSQDINRIGNYTNCISWSEVKSSWTSQDGANPYMGEVGQISYADELRVEFKCEYKEIERVVEFIKSIHPYEEVEIDIIPLIELK